MVCNCSPKKKRQEIRKISYLLFNYSNNSFELDQNVKFNYSTVKHKFTVDDLQNDFTSPRKEEKKNNLMGSSIKLSNRHISAAGLVSSALFFSCVEI